MRDVPRRWPDAATLPLEEWWLRNNIEGRDSARSSSAGLLRVLQKDALPIFSSALSCTSKRSMRILDSRGTAISTMTSALRTAIFDCVFAATNPKNKLLSLKQLDQD